MSVCVECADVSMEESKTCDDCELPYCSTWCREHHGRCAVLARLPQRPGHLSAAFLAKPGIAVRCGFWRAAMQPQCFLCVSQTGLARSGTVLCAACHRDFVLGRAKKQQRPPPPFRVDADMQVVEADRLNDMLHGAPTQTADACRAVWDMTHKWPVTVETYNLLLNGRPLPRNTRYIIREWIKLHTEGEKEKSAKRQKRSASAS